MQMLACLILKGSGAVEVGKYRLGKGVPDSGNGWDKGFTMPRYAHYTALHRNYERNLPDAYYGAGEGVGE